MVSEMGNPVFSRDGPANSIPSHSLQHITKLATVTTMGKDKSEKKAKKEKKEKKVEEAGGDDDEYEELSKVGGVAG